MCDKGVGLAFPATVPPVFANATELAQYNADVADEWAAKVGALYRFASTGTTIGGIVEYMQRDVPAFLQFQDERTRWGSVDAEPAHLRARCLPG